MQLIIINGVTGAIGSALLDVFAREANTAVVGLSRKATPYQKFLTPEGKLRVGTFISSVNGTRENYKGFVECLSEGAYTRIAYFHCVGKFPFEIDSTGEFRVEGDLDGDGIDDEVSRLSYDLFRWMVESLIETEIPMQSIIFGGLAEKANPQILHSWCITMKKTETFMQSVATDQVGMVKVNISSVLCTHELLTRPFVFLNTDADPQAWLSPHQLAQQVQREISRDQGGFREVKIYNPWNGFFAKWYADTEMVPRRLAELGE